MDVTPRTLNKGTWQEKLLEYCQQQNYRAPEYHIVSERKGGRTSWSAVVTIHEGNKMREFKAKSWYDGQFINNAKEDAAQVAYDSLLYGTGQTTKDAPSAADSGVQSNADSTAPSATE